MPLLRRAATAVTVCLIIGFGAPAAFADERIPTPMAGDQTPADTPTSMPTPSPTASIATPKATEAAPQPATTPASAAPIAPAAVGETYTLAAESLCPSALDPAVTNLSGAVSVDLDKVGTYTWLAIDSDAAASCLDSMTSFEIVGTGTNVEEIQIGKNAFAQTSGAANTLTTVRFPDGVKRIDIGSGAFAQYSTVGANALKEVRFPATTADSVIVLNDAFRQETTASDANNALTSVSITASSLTCAPGSFAQYSTTGDNALTRVTFAVTNDKLDVGDGAFQQTAGGNNALTSVAIPSGVVTSQIGESAFAQEAGGDNALASISLPTSLTGLDVFQGAFSQKAGGHNALTSLSFPHTMNYLNADISSFAQTTTGDADTALTSVEFPTTIAMLVVGDSAFTQTSEGGNATLRTIHFPTSTSYGTGLGNQAFAQTATNGRTALTSVILPAITPMMIIDQRAFAQTSTSNTLTRVVFPTTLNVLLVDHQAFAQSSSSVLSELIFPFSAPPSAGTYFDLAAAPISGVDWVWFGADKAQISDWPIIDRKSVAAAQPKLTATAFSLEPQGVSASQVLSGYRTLALKNLDAAKTRYVYRDGQTVTAPLSGQATTIGPANANGGWTTTLPSATSALGHFAGWCTTAVTGTAACTGDTLRSGSAYTVSSNTQLWASWRAAAILPPTIPAQSLGTGTVGKAYRQAITVEGGGTITCAITSGTLPAGVSLHDCVLSGTPTAAGTFTFTVTATNSAGSSARHFTLAVSVSSDQLAHTGADAVLPLISLAGLLILGGAALRLRSRQRPSRGDHPHTLPEAGH